MISKISFGSVYRYRNNFKSEAMEHYSALKPIRIIKDNIHNLNRGDSVLLHHEGSGDYILAVPDYMDETLEEYCLYNGIECEKD